MKELKYLVLGFMIFLCTGFVSFADEKLDDPQNLYWEDSVSSQAMVFFDPVEGAAVHVVTIYRDGEVCVPEYEYDYYPLNPSGYGFDFSRHFEESGSYTFSVQAKKIAAYIDSEYDSEIVMCPEPYEYVRPNVALENPQNLRWSNEKTGVVMWDMTTTQARYMVWLFLDGKPKSGFSGRFVRADKVGSYDFSSSFKEEGEYTFAVMALSSSIETVAHSQFSYCDDVFDLTGHNLDIRNEVEKLVNASPSNAREALEDIGADDLAIAMQSDSSTRESIKAIEKRYNTTMGVTVKKKIDEKLGIDSDSISIVGAGLNVASGNDAVYVNFNVPEEEVVVNYESYSSVLQMDISIIGTESNELAVPISLEMKIPASIDIHSMVILHYYQDGSFEAIPFHVISREADGTLIRFTVTSFSPYVFAVESDDNGNGDNGNGDNGNGDNGNGDNGNGDNSNGDNGNGDNGNGDNGNGDNSNGDNGNGDNGNGDNGNGDNGNGDNGNGDNGNGDNGNGNNGNGNSGSSGSSKKSSSTSTANKSTWQKEQSGWKYTKASGKYAKSEWLKINGSWYWFKDDEVMATGWTYWNENWYYLSKEADAEEGAMNSGWVYDSAYDGWFFLDAEGRLLTGWQMIEGKWYYFNPVSDGTKGKMTTDSYVDSFYVNASGELEER